ncbi:hypothetical protein [Rhodopirellula sp. MGV]|uniref:hypothetical protein n=1 Tax=Rhodopirellula sp. MGV TaxID=2023130 RepID=UPI000BC9C33C|nr:hypothetical protein [Rhodopirellula sp. MGV]OYP35455.1 hypothetical protein CGZ80_11475 [Rhodopirellula sp. MGV]
MTDETPNIKISGANIQSSGNVQIGSAPADCSLTEAIRETLVAIEQRSRRHRNLVITIVAWFFLVAMTAILVWSLEVLIAWLAIVVIIGGSLARDSVAVHRWLDGVVSRFEEERFGIGVLMEALRTNPSIPKETLASMLAMLEEIQPSLEAASDPLELLSIRRGIQSSMRHQWLHIVIGSFLFATLLGLGILMLTNPGLPTILGFVVTLAVWLIVRLKG